MQHMRRRGALMRGAPSWSRLWVSGRCRRSGCRTDGGLLLDVLHPLVVTNVSLRGAG